uniref:Uncharacterized protein n=2 Tax=Emiliania huxleyi TaxID=2903 RepID=A0A7S3VZ13_EMIHU
MTVGDATRILDCLVREGKVPLFLATDNTPLKAAVLGSGAGLNASVLLPRSVTARVRAQGCAECMVNPVFKHDFNRSDVAEIFLDLMMLTLSRCFYHGGSNFANTVLALAPPGHCDKHIPRREHACAAPAG